MATQNKAKSYIVLHEGEAVGQVMTYDELKHFIENHEIYDYLNEDADLDEIGIFEIIDTKLKIESNLKLVDG